MNITTLDKHSICGIHEVRGNNDEIVILSHGITSEKNEGGLYTELARQLGEAGYSSYRFDYRGHGESPLAIADLTISGEVLDLYAVLSHFNKRYRKVTLVAASFAASIALLLFRHYMPSRLSKVAFLNPVTSYANTFTLANTQWAKGFFPQDGLESALSNMPICVGSNKFSLDPKMVSELYMLQPELTAWPERIPLRIYHGKDDAIVSVTDSVSFINSNSTANISHVFYDGAGHGLDDVKAEMFGNLVSYFNG